MIYEEKGMLKVKKQKLIILFVLCLQIMYIVGIRAFEIELNYSQMAKIAISQTLISIIFLKIICNLSIISIPNIFAFFSLIFHCGQLIKEGFHMEGSVPLPFESYGDEATIQKAFIFFLVSQIIYFIFVTFICNSQPDKTRWTKWNEKEKINILTYAKVLIIFGIIPRLYIDIVSLIGARNSGYEGVYSIYIPQAIQSIAFFFDAGMIFLIYGLRDKKKQKLWFLGIVIYKCVMMSTGARQDKVAFLLIWIYIYFFVINKITIKKLIFVVMTCAAGFMFVSAIGTARTSNTVGLSQTFNLLQSGTMNNVLGNALGEFGSAFVTLETAIKYTPSRMSYGYGRSYIAGILSSIPLLVNRIPILSETVIFLNQLPKRIVFAFGGSFLGELYYNFSWFGILGCGIVGVIVTKIHDGFTNTNCKLYKAWCSVVATALILFVRGYFTDMVQKLVWTYILIYLVQLYVMKRYNRKDM